MFISLTFHPSILEPIFQSSHQIANAFGLEKCVFCQDGMDGLHSWREVCLLRLFGSAYYLHIFNDSYPRRVRALSQLGIFDPANYSSYLIATAICLIPPACPQWQHFTSSSYVVVCLCLVQLSYSGDWNSSRWRILCGFEPPAWDLCEEWLFCDGLEEREKMQMQ